MMEFNDRKTDPPSTRELLYNQVKEQSDLCDITIKHGFWEKRFHWCVLVASPYFENIRRNSFIEKDLGVVSMKFGTPVSLEEAILFLYGKKPKLHIKNIGSILEVAEYLIIPELKGQCVQWIKSKSTDADNCMAMLRLASLYNFDLPTYEEYLKGRIPDLMMADGLLDLTYESVEYLFTDPLLSYVNTRDKFSFLVRWINYRCDRKTQFGDLVKHISFEDAEKDFIEKVVMNEPLIHDLDNAADFIKLLKQKDFYVYCDVLIFPQQLENNKIQCFDLTRKRWCSIHAEINNKPEHFQTYKIRGSRCQSDTKMPDIYVLQEEYSYSRKASIFKLNLENNTVEEYRIEVDESYQEQIRYSNDLTNIWQDKFFMVSEEQTHYPGSEQTGFDLQQLRVLLNAGIQVDPILLHAAIGTHARNKVISCSVLYTGSLQNGVIVIQPILCIRDKVSQICANNTFLAMLSENEKLLYLYNVVEHSLDTLTLEMDKDGQGFKLANMEMDNFVLYNNKCFMTIARQFGPNLHQKYQVDKHQFRKDDMKRCQVNTYYLCENKWYHYSRSMDEETMFTTTTHNKLVASIQARDGGFDMDPNEVWEALPSDGYKTYHSLGSNVLQIRLSKDRLACAKNCPHCKVQDQSTRTTYYHDTDEDDSDDDSYDNLYYDHYGYDDYCGYRERPYNFYGYDSDQYYYYSSD